MTPAIGSRWQPRPATRDGRHTIEVVEHGSGALEGLVLCRILSTGAEFLSSAALWAAGYYTAVEEER